MGLGKANCWVWAEPTKSAAGIRDVAVPPHLIPSILQLLDTFTALDKALMRFPCDSGRPQRPSTIASYFKKPATVEAATTSATPAQ